MDVRATDRSGFSSHRFSTFLDMTPDDTAYLKAVTSRPREFDRHATVRRQGDPVEGIFMLCEGWAASSVDLPDGQRQIVKVHLPGDLMGAPSLSLAAAAETLVAITPIVVASILPAALTGIFKEKPLLAANMFLCAQQERIFLMDRITSIGRMNAQRRLGAFLLHIHERLVAAGGTPGQLEMPLTQTQLGDIVGLTPVHVNRVLQALDSTKLIERSGATIRAIDVSGLRRLVGLPHREWVHEPAWLKQIRHEG